MNYLPDIAWSTRVEDVELAPTPYHFYCTVNPLDPNDPGFGEIEIGYILLDFNGYPFEVVGFGDDDDDDDEYRIEVYDINERGDGTNSAYAPYPDREAYIYEPKNSGVILSQAQLRKLDRSAADVIEPIEKGVLWAHRGLEITPNEQLGIENITALRLSDKFTLDEEEEGWQGGKSYKLDVSSSSAPSEYLVKNIEQIAHGFILDFVFFDNTVWVKAIATTGETCATHFARKINDDNFELIPVGELLIEGLLDENGDALVTGDYYFLSQTVEGKVTGVKPEEGIIQSVLKVNATNTITISIQEPYDINDVGGGAGIDLQLTTIGDGGAATLDLETGALNIPIYQEQLVSSSNIKTVNSTTLLGSGNLSVGTVTSVAALTLGTTGTDVSSSVANGTTTPVITLNIPTASAANRGALSSADWTTFNNKQNTLVSGTNIKTVATNSILGSGSLINITISATEPNTGGELNGDIWVES